MLLAEFKPIRILEAFGITANLTQMFTTIFYHQFLHI